MIASRGRAALDARRELGYECSSGVEGGPGGRRVAPAGGAQFKAPFAKRSAMMAPTEWGSFAAVVLVFAASDLGVGAGGA